MSDRDVIEAFSLFLLGIVLLVVSIFIEDDKGDHDD